MQIHSGPHNTSSFKNGLWWKVLVCSLGILGLGTASGLSSIGNIQEWYADLNKPFSTASSWLF